MDQISKNLGYTQPTLAATHATGRKSNEVSEAVTGGEDSVSLQSSAEAPAGSIKHIASASDLAATAKEQSATLSDGGAGRASVADKACLALLTGGAYGVGASLAATSVAAIVIHEAPMAWFGIVAATSVIGGTIGAVNGWRSAVPMPPGSSAREMAALATGGVIGAGVGAGTMAFLSGAAGAMPWVAVGAAMGAGLGALGAAAAYDRLTGSPLWPLERQQA